MTHAANCLSDDIEAAVEAFEDAALTGRSVSVREFLPDRTSPSWLAVLQELIRVALEQDFHEHGTGSVESYRGEFPELFESTDAIAPLVFEEYRLRLRGGETVTPAVYADRYGIETSRWPELENDGRVSADRGRTIRRVETVKTLVESSFKIN